MSGDWPQVIYRLQIGPAPDPAWRRLPSPACERVVIKEQVAMRVLTSKKNERSDQQEGGRNGPLLTVYSEVSKAHASIMEFRAKLLTLLPLASGTGIFLVLQGNIPGFKPEYMKPSQNLLFKAGTCVRSVAESGILGLDQGKEGKPSSLARISYGALGTYRIPPCRFTTHYANHSIKGKKNIFFFPNTILEKRTQQRG
jgi:hypothetical protein